MGGFGKYSIGLAEQMYDGNVERVILRCKTKTMNEELNVRPPYRPCNDNIEVLNSLFHKIELLCNEVPTMLPMSPNGAENILTKYKNMKNVDFKKHCSKDLTAARPLYLEIGDEIWDANLLSGYKMNLGCCNLRRIRLAFKIITRMTPPKERDYTLIE